MPGRCAYMVDGAGRRSAVVVVVGVGSDGTITVRAITPLVDWYADDGAGLPIVVDAGEEFDTRGEWLALVEAAG